MKFHSAVIESMDGFGVILFSETDKEALHNKDNKSKLSHDLIGLCFQMKCHKLRTPETLICMSLEL